MNKTIKNNMKRILLIILMLGLINNVQAFSIIEPSTVGLIQLPETSMNVITLHSIENDSYGFSNDSYPTVHNLQIPYEQDWNHVFFKIGYVPICPTQSNNTILSLYCENVYIDSWNYSENCENDGDYEYKWISFDLRNRTVELFQTITPSTTLTCSFYVNESEDERVDFWVRLENTGNKVVEEVRTEIILEELQPITSGINAFVEIINLFLTIILTTLRIIIPIWSFVAFPIIIIVVAYLFAIRVKEIIDGLRGK